VLSASLLISRPLFYGLIEKLLLFLLKGKPVCNKQVCQPIMSVLDISGIYLL